MEKSQPLWHKILDNKNWIDLSKEDRTWCINLLCSSIFNDKIHGWVFKQLDLLEKYEDVIKNLDDKDRQSKRILELQDKITILEHKLVWANIAADRSWDNINDTPFK